MSELSEIVIESTIQPPSLQPSLLLTTILTKSSKLGWGVIKKKPLLFISKILQCLSVYEHLNFERKLELWRKIVSVNTKVSYCIGKSKN